MKEAPEFWQWRAITPVDLLKNPLTSADNCIYNNYDG
jgi:hypothetical protein